MVTGAGLPLPQPWLLAVWATHQDFEALAGAPMLPVPGHPLERPQTQPTQAEATGSPGPAPWLPDVGGDLFQRGLC